MSTIQIRINPERKLALEKIAEKFQESLSTFMLKSALLRAELGQEPSLAKDPFLAALENLTRGQKPEKLDPKLKAEIEAGRRRRAEGKEVLKPISEARKSLKQL